MILFGSGRSLFLRGFLGLGLLLLAGGGAGASAPWGPPVFDADFHLQVLEERWPPVVAVADTLLRILDPLVAGADGAQPDFGAAAELLLGLEAEERYGSFLRQGVVRPGQELELRLVRRPGEGPSALGATLVWRADSGGGRSDGALFFAGTGPEVHLRDASGRVWRPWRRSTAEAATVRLEVEDAAAGEYVLTVRHGGGCRPETFAVLVTGARP